jgi:hypothetical protein
MMSISLYQLNNSNRWLIVLHHDRREEPMTATLATIMADGHVPDLVARDADLARPMRLFTARAVVRRGDVLITAFAAGVADTGGSVAEALRTRMGVPGSMPYVEEGFDDFDPFSLVMVPPVLSEEIVRVAEAPNAGEHRGYGVFVERRFAV